MVSSEEFFQAAFSLIGILVVGTVLVGVTLWVNWFRGTATRNLCGDRSSELITRLDQPAPRWSFFDFFLNMGIMILVASSLFQMVRTPEKPSEEAPESVTVRAVVAQPAPPPALEDPTALKDPDVGDAEGAQAEPSPAKTTEELTDQVGIHFIANAVAFLVSIALLRWVYGLSLNSLSLVPREDDIRRGLYATVWILAPVLLINLVISNLVQYEHTVTDLLALETGWQTFAGLFFTAAIVTPVVEEFQFRLLLQGGLQRIAEMPSGDASATVEASVEAAAEDRMAAWRPRRAWPVIVTSMVFALMHFGQGAAPIPLFFLSVGLGFLYQRTGRLFPAIVVHAMLNGTTLCMEFCRVNSGI